MKKTSLVFSLVREQSVFMTVVISVLTFMAVLAFGISLSIGSGVIRWNNQWDKYATVQVIDSNKSETVKKVFENNRDKIESVREISNSEMERIMKPWISGGAKLKNYLPQMFELKLKKSEHMDYMRNEISKSGKFLTHTSALEKSISVGWKIFLITMFILMLIMVSIGVCVSYISRNIAMLHKHELEILNQVGASDDFIAKQMQIIVGKISINAGLIGFVAAAPILALILSVAHSARTGLLAMMTLSSGNWIALMILPLAIVILSIYITKKTTLKILSGN